MSIETKNPDLLGRGLTLIFAAEYEKTIFFKRIRERFE